MIKSNAQRQKEYRQRHLKDVEGEGAMIKTMVNLRAKDALKRLAVCYGVTQREIIERILLSAERATMDHAVTLPHGADDYYDGRLRLEFSDVTP